MNRCKPATTNAFDIPVTMSIQQQPLTRYSLLKTRKFEFQSFEQRIQGGIWHLATLKQSLALGCFISRLGSHI
jgi:hypothetical protein